ncbi:PEPxxWA-CTERM sorting domain-containing protein [Phenylobacterium sp. LH3H17]|uniref:PEPxxWA-CTERM sorting domain-containing protein n=1 Tax=Phenylobacterium sp. LH3H17 TaxID=2903901 RepID=UPI0020C9414C|nr:PEPxxWA-CTERM sorting domain-containing protein [Phenylobacterium sp. LH3H17]UTP40886.1 PEPxxWA-CTERM sorting domain-containing protein [Phenylobacterium sp. LH3H17]
MKTRLLCGAAALLGVVSIAGSASAAGFVNGAFETGTAAGWTESSSTYRASVDNANLTTAFVKANTGSGMHSSIISAGTIDPNVGAALGSTVYSGNYSYRVEDTTYGGYASLIEQQVNNYTDANIFFAWKSVLLGAHGVDDAATMIIVLKDLTANTELLRREYNAASGGGGVDARFTLDGSGNYYTKDWQIEQLAIGGALGHDLLLSVIGSDCQPTGHWGYVYLDGFGSVTPPPTGGGIPEPSTWAMMIAGFGLAGSALRRRRPAALMAA